MWGKNGKIKKLKKSAFWLGSIAGHPNNPSCQKTEPK